MKKILSYSFKLKHLNQFFFHLVFTKHNFFSCKYKVHILMGFKSHIKKIKYSFSIYLVNFDMS